MEEEGRGGKKGTADIVSNRRASVGHGTGLPVDAPMGLRLEGSFNKNRPMYENVGCGRASERRLRIAI